MNFPKLDSSKKETKLQELFGQHYDKVVQDKAESERRMREMQKVLNRINSVRTVLYCLRMYGVMNE